MARCVFAYHHAACCVPVTRCKQTCYMPVSVYDNRNSHVAQLICTRLLQSLLNSTTGLAATIRSGGCCTSGTSRWLCVCKTSRWLCQVVNIHSRRCKHVSYCMHSGSAALSILAGLLQGVADESWQGGTSSSSVYLMQGVDTGWLLHVCDCTVRYWLIAKAVGHNSSLLGCCRKLLNAGGRDQQLQLYTSHKV